MAKAPIPRSNYLKFDNLDALRSLHCDFVNGGGAASRSQRKKVVGPSNEVLNALYASYAAGMATLDDLVESVHKFVSAKAERESKSFTARERDTVDDEVNNFIVAIYGALAASGRSEGSCARHGNDRGFGSEGISLLHQFRVVPSSLYYPGTNN